MNSDEISKFFFPSKPLPNMSGRSRILWTIPPKDILLQQPSNFDCNPQQEIYSIMTQCSHTNKPKNIFSMCSTVLHFLCYPTCDVLLYLNNNAIHSVWIVYDPLFGKHCVTDPALRKYISVPQSICLFGEMRKSDTDACEMHPSRHA